MKRFTDTEKWIDPWFRKLNPKEKLIWIYLVDNCDHAGIWKVDLELMSFMIGTEVSFEDLKYLNGRIERINPENIFINKFIEFQYGCKIDQLNPNNSAHLGVLRKIQSVKNKGHIRGISAPIIGAKDKDKDKDKDTRGSVEGEMLIEVKEIIDYFISTFELEEIERFFKNNGGREKVISDWVETIRKCVEIDKFKYWQIKDILSYVREWHDEQNPGKFSWRKNFKSIKKLRDRTKSGEEKIIDYIWDTIKDQMEEPEIAAQKTQR